MGRSGKTERTEENLEIVIGEVESEVIRKLGTAPSKPASSVWDLERKRGGVHNTMKPVDHTPVFTEAYHRRGVGK